MVTSSSIFFFQAEGGIRGRTVAGVQTCALPILAPRGCRWCSATPTPRPRSRYGRSRTRSEERRVGKSVDLGGRRIIKKKKGRKPRERDRAGREDGEMICVGGGAKSH